MWERVYNYELGSFYHLIYNLLCADYWKVHSCLNGHCSCGWDTSGEDGLNWRILVCLSCDLRYNMDGHCWLQLNTRHICFVNFFMRPVGLECRFQTWHRTLKYVNHSYVASMLMVMVFCADASLYVESEPQRRWSVITNCLLLLACLLLLFCSNSPAFPFFGCHILGWSYYVMILNLEIWNYCGNFFVFCYFIGWFIIEHYMVQFLSFLTPWASKIFNINKTQYNGTWAGFGEVEVYR